jgi:hypothetical protein
MMLVKPPPIPRLGKIFGENAAGIYLGNEIGATAFTVTPWFFLVAM